MMNSEQQQHISTTNAITTAKILTRDVLPKLTGYLDASDVVEFYAVTRMAKLKTPPFPQPRSTDAPTVAPTSNQTMQPTKPLNYGDDDSGLNDGGSRGNINATNSTSNSYYYSSTGSGQSNNDDGNRTLMGWPNIWGRGDVEEEKTLPTIIPQQVTTNSQPEVMIVQKSALAFRYRPPTSQRPDSPRAKKPFELTLEFGPQRTGADMESEAIPIIEGDYSTSTEEGGGKFVSWNNEGKVYYETSIDAVRWDSANFMAPITGAVLSKVLDFAVEYTTQFPRYQPFEVYDVAQDVTLVHSSGSDDFVWSLFGRLASLNVNLRPLLPQPKRKVRLYVNTSWEQDMLEMIQQTDGNNEPPDEAAGSSNTIEEGAEGDSNAVSTTLKRDSYKVVQRIEAVYVNKEAAEFFEELYRCGHSIRNNAFSYGTTTLPSDVSHNTTKPEDDDATENIADAHNSTNKGSNELNLPVTSPSPSSRRNQTHPSGKSKNDTQVTNNSKTPSPTRSSAKPPSQDRKEKKNNGIRALSRLSVSTTSASLDLPPKNALLSGDGKLMMSTLASCFESPPVGNVVYLYVDGVTYYKVNLTKPYWNTSILNEPLPAPFLYSQGQSDALDWSLAMLILGGFFLGVYLILIQSGIVKTTPASVRRCLNSFFRSEQPKLSTGGSYSSFNRKKYSDIPASEDNSFYSEDAESFEGDHSQSNNSNTNDEEDNIGSDSNHIELKESSTQLDFLQDPGNFTIDDLLSEKIEVVNAGSSGDARLDGTHHAESFNSFGSNLNLEADSTHSRNVQAADVVERPNLKSSSKVAVPVGIAKRINEMNEKRQPLQQTNLKESKFQIV